MKIYLNISYVHPLKTSGYHIQNCSDIKALHFPQECISVFIGLITTATSYVEFVGLTAVVMNVTIFRDIAICEQTFSRNVGSNTDYMVLYP
jgi:hypothetical protein